MKKLLICLTIIFTVFILSCSNNNVNIIVHENNDISGFDPSTIELPSDFEFELIWSTFGNCSYDSNTGKLIKDIHYEMYSKDSKYTRYVKMSENELKLVYKYLCLDIDISSYPKEYDPYNDPNTEIKKWTSPNDTITINVTFNNKNYYINCKELYLLGTIDDCYDDKSRTFVTSTNNLISLIESFPEWNEMPESSTHFM